MVIKIRANIIIMVAITLSSISPSYYHNLVTVMIITMTITSMMIMMSMASMYGVGCLLIRERSQHRASD